MVPLSFAHHEFQVVAPAALYWPAQDAVLVADLHLEKASFFAAEGQMLPPYDSRATLDELAQIIAATGASRVFCLGDNYHDNGGEARLETRAADCLMDMTARTDWLWISGNHDHDVSGIWGGTVAQERIIDGIALRHEATRDTVQPEISGHYHPKLRVPVRHRKVARRCFVRGPKHLIMPAFGALTGGLDAAHEAIEKAIGGPADALLPVGGLAEGQNSGKLLSFPLPFDWDRSNENTQLDLALASGKA